MPNTYEGQLVAAGLRCGIVVSRFNELVTRQLLQGAEDALLRHGADAAAIDVAWVPGAFEIPVAARAMAGSGRYDAVICLGALIRGATPHFNYLAGAVAGALQGIAVETGIPVVFGVLTTDTLEQAIERAGTKAGNKGYDAAVTAIEMASLLGRMRNAFEAERGG
jgi:6,7-dimethyl-8-ribityllumazine synthase